MRARRCPECANQQLIHADNIQVTLQLPPNWWPDDTPWHPHSLGSVDRTSCGRCGWEREVWTS